MDFFRNEYFVLISKTGTKLAVIEKNMQLGNEFLKFFKHQKEIGKWNGQFLKEYEAEIFEKRKSTNVSDTLIIRPNRKIFIEPGVMIIFMLAGFIMLIYGIISLVRGDSIGVTFLGIGIATIGYLFTAVIMLWIDAWADYKKWCLTLTPGICNFTDRAGRTISFSFDEIEDVIKWRTEGRNSREYRIVKFNNNRKDIKVLCEYTMDNAKNIKSFVAFHKKTGK